MFWYVVIRDGGINKRITTIWTKMDYYYKAHSNGKKKKATVFSE